jgi:hypothetical protein
MFNPFLSPSQLKEKLQEEPDEKDMAVVDLRKAIKESIEVLGEEQTRDNIVSDLKVLTGKE